MLFTAPVGFPSNQDPMLKALSSYPNIQYRNVNWYNYSVGSPVEEWIKEDEILKTKHYLGHLSDFLRFLSIYKFGGIHVDLDFIVLKSFDDLLPNFIGAQEPDCLQSSIFGFDKTDLGHKFAEMHLRFAKY